MDDAAIERLKAIAHPARFSILNALRAGESNVGEIEAATGITQPALSQQLSVLRHAGLVSTRREAKLVFYTLDGAVLAELAQAMSSLVPDATLASCAKASGPHASGHGAAVFATIQR